MAKSNGAAPVSPKDEIIDIDALTMLATKYKDTLNSLYDPSQEMEQVEAGLWKPKEKGDNMFGVYIGKVFEDSVVNSFGEAVPCLKFFTKADDGTPTTMKVRETAVLKRLFENIQEGTGVEVVYEGEVAGKAGQQQTKLFSLFRTKRAQNTP